MITLTVRAPARSIIPRHNRDTALPRISCYRATRPRKVADFSRRLAQFDAGLIFEKIVLPPPGPGFTSNWRTSQFDNLTKRGKASGMS